MKAGDRKLKTLDSSAKQDTQIAAGMVTAGLISDEGIQAIEGVLKGANDPTQALAHVIFMALGKVREKLEQKGMHIDDKVWIAGGGVLDRVLFEVMMVLHGVLDYKPASDSTFVHNVKSTILDLMNDNDEGGAQEGTPQEEQQDMPPDAAQGLASPAGMPQQGAQ